MTENRESIENKNTEAAAENQPGSAGSCSAQEKQRKRRVFLADMGLLFVALFWGGGFVAGKFALESFTPMNLLVLRYFGASAVLFLLCIKRLRNFTKKTVICGAVCGLLVFIGNALQTVGLLYTTPGKQSFIISLYVVLVPLISWAALKIKPEKKIIIAAFIALLGISLLTLTDDLTVNKGDFLTFIFAAAFSVQVIFTGLHINSIDAPLFTFTQVFTAGILSSIAALFMKQPMVAAPLTAQSILGVIYLMTFNSAFAFSLQNLCQKYAPTNHTAILLSTETVFGTIFAVTLAGEVFAGRKIWGCVLMFLAIAIAEFPAKIRRQNKENGQSRDTL